MASTGVAKKDINGNPSLWYVCEKIAGKHKKKYYHSEREAKLARNEAEARELATGEGSQVVARGNLSVYFNKIAELQKTNKARENTKVGYRSAQAFLESIGITQVEELTTENIKKGIAVRTDLEPSTIDTYLMKINKIVTELNRTGIYPKFNKNEIKESLPKRFAQIAKERKEYLSLQEFQNISDWFADKDMMSRWLVIQVLGQYGFRINELLLSSVKDIRDNALVINIEIEKTWKTRHVPLPKEIIDQIMQTRAKYNTTDSNALFIDEVTGSRLNYRTMQKWWNKCVNELKIENKTLHHLRALGFFVLYEATGHDMALVKEICGWNGDAWSHYSGKRRDQLPFYFNAIASMIGSNTVCDSLNSPISKTISSLFDANKEVLEKVETIDKTFLNTLIRTKYNSEFDKAELILKHLGYELKAVKISSLPVASTDAQSDTGSRPQEQTTELQSCLF